MIEFHYETEFEKTYKGPDGTKTYKSINKFSLLNNAKDRIEEETRKGHKFIGLYKVQREKIDYAVS